MTVSPRPRGRRLFVLIWIVIIAIYVFLSYDYIRVRLNDNDLSSYLDYVVLVGGNENRPAKEIRALILVKAEELGLPLRGDQIQITGERQNLRIALSYDVDITVPGLKKPLYHKTFDHQASYHLAR